VRSAIWIRNGWEPHGLRFIGDPHIDAPDHAREKLIADLEDAKEKGDSIVVMGDVWSFILPRDLKRFTSGQHGQKKDAIINDAIKKAE
jgi:UDP-2,3-diacylglucosamine pyrophosphatase LpxH